MNIKNFFSWLKKRRLKRPKIFYIENGYQPNKGTLDRTRPPQGGSAFSEKKNMHIEPNPYDYAIEIMNGGTLTVIKAIEKADLLTPNNCFLKTRRENEDAKSIHLNNCFIGNPGAIQVAKYLQCNYFIETLHLKNNFIGDEGIKALAEALKSNYTLSNIDLGFNIIGDLGGKALVEALKVNRTLKYLSVKSHSMTQEVADALLQVCNKHPIFIGLDMF